ncbi:hypothetical protein M2459_002966 [Parabacteroides sp. PF5-5]|uniref:DUF2975 domain-containing protein n=1 Tax=unclassified Parabacteroides TaxID=2649774 RepID=UPI002475F71B|nr:MULTISPECIES: DUF2975 domain-containing protein [unclassified Parabacteroides]MDH6305955.1 hypothetical protein [Parabacteroides sp. PH5-39]MDH6317211.1 hypothetical protein [Parabacteroides sp. PF5-13]MDH6320667.1 hypothetical protein [Parabacteroides sp. PH5-13]MDH6324412.1 hypothetical protein [Parabacteroides sp. PH5-8]MDH6328396.1 hypothetical protein [Parabacteroides sp. PH5-41]
MEKRRINIIFFALLALLLFVLGNGMHIAISNAIKGGTEVYSNEEERHSNFVECLIQPSGTDQYPDKTIRLSDNQTIRYKTQSVEAEIEIPLWVSASKGILVLLIFVLLIFSIAYFVKFIRNIKNGAIFIKPNIKYMRFIAITLLTNFLYFNFYDYIEYLIAKKQFYLEGYQLSTPDFRLGPLWVSLIFFLFAEIFAYGIRLKEEQELTI